MFSIQVPKEVTDKVVSFIDSLAGSMSTIAHTFDSINDRTLAILEELREQTSIFKARDARTKTMDGELTGMRKMVEALLADVAPDKLAQHVADGLHVEVVKDGKIVKSFRLNRGVDLYDLIADIHEDVVALNEDAGPDGLNDEARTIVQEAPGATKNAEGD